MLCGLLARLEAWLFEHATFGKALRDWRAAAHPASGQGDRLRWDDYWFPVCRYGADLSLPLAAVTVGPS